jgi:hypothetical protein
MNMNTATKSQMPSIAHFITSQQEAVAGAERRAAAAVGIAVRLDPLLISTFRHTDFAVDYSTIAFEKLKRSIDQTGGNIAPIKVRTLPEGGHEIVFGHARLQACLHLGLPVLATVEDLSDSGLLQQFVVHQRFKRKLSIWRLGSVLDGALQAGFFPSPRRMAEQLGMDLSEVDRLTRLDRLPGRIKDELKGKTLSLSAMRKLFADHQR